MADTATCPVCRTTYPADAARWVTRVKAGTIFRFPCEHQAVGTFDPDDHTVTYTPVD